MPYIVCYICVCVCRNASDAIAKWIHLSDMLLIVTSNNQKPYEFLMANVGHNLFLNTIFGNVS